MAEVAKTGEVDSGAESSRAQRRNHAASMGNDPAPPVPLIRIRG